MSNHNMGERRITHHSQNENKLKAVAGLLQQLSYSEMTTLAELVGKEVQTAALDTNGIARALLTVSNEILKPAPLSDARFAS